MKKSIILLLVIALLTVVSCNKKQDVSDMLKNQETKKEIFNAIVDNHDYMMDFMETMQNNEHVMQMMQENKIMMGHMMKGKGMLMMMTDSTQMKTMKLMMHQKGMMCNQCMKRRKNEGIIDNKK